MLSKDELLAGHYDPAVVDRPFVVRAADAGTADARIAAWLETPNSSLGEERPGNLLRGNASNRRRLGYAIAEMEQGTFS